MIVLAVPETHVWIQLTAADLIAVSKKQVLATQYKSKVINGRIRLNLSLSTDIFDKWLAFPPNSMLLPNISFKHPIVYLASLRFALRFLLTRISMCFLKSRGYKVMNHGWILLNMLIHFLSKRKSRRLNRIEQNRNLQNHKALASSGLAKLSKDMKGDELIICED